MVKEIMTPEERVWTAIRLQKPDRGHINILASAAYAQVTGSTVAEWYRNTDENKQWTAIDKVWDYTGGWDLNLASLAQSNPMATKVAMAAAMGVRMKFPGVDLPDN